MPDPSAWARERMSPRPRTLVIQGNTIWMWPGVPLTLKFDDVVRPLSATAIHLWISRLHGFEADPPLVQVAIQAAADRLTAGNRHGATAALASSGLERISPEGFVLATAIGRHFGIEVPDFAVGTRPAPWGAGQVISDVPRFRKFAAAAVTLRKSWDPEKHPRWPLGSPDSQGGRFSLAGATNGDADPSSTAGDTPGIGHNGGPPLEPPPDVPVEEPPTKKLLNKFLKGAARWLVKATLAGAKGAFRRFMGLLIAATWLYKAFPYVRAYLDGPKSLEELRQAIGDPQTGYEIHHIVEQTQAERDGLPRSQVDSPENLVRISTLKHWEITGWYMRPNTDYGGILPREYLRGKSWEERWRVGLEALRRFGVLNP